jgi:hypothetical protein
MVVMTRLPVARLFRTRTSGDRPLNKGPLLPVTGTILRTARSSSSHRELGLLLRRSLCA